MKYQLGVTVHYFGQTNFKHAKVAIFVRILLCHCKICPVLAKYMGILNKIMKGDPPIIISYFPSKVFQDLFTENDMNFQQSV